MSEVPLYAAPLAHEAAHSQQALTHVRNCAAIHLGNTPPVSTLRTVSRRALI